MIKLIRPFTLLLLISAIGLHPITSVFADGVKEEENSDIEISLSPNDTLFDISNMKPGDWAPRSITVKNSGNNEFQYHMELQNKGDHKLFNELLLEVKAGDEELYQGKLAGFKSIPARKVISGNEESLELTIRFPEHLGNDFQGVQSEFNFTFTAEGKDSTPVQAISQGLIESDGPTLSGFSLPATSTNLFNLLLYGSALVVGGIVLMTIRHYRRRKLVE